jgi:hypothetical protein
MACTHEQVLRDVLSRLIIVAQEHAGIDGNVSEEQLARCISDLSRGLLDSIAMIANSLAPERAEETAAMVTQAYADFDMVDQMINEEFR